MKPAPKNAFFHSASLALGASLVIFTATLSASAATFTWDGGGADALGTTAANWLNDIAPTNGPDIQFNAAGVSGNTVTWGTWTAPVSGNLITMTFNPGASAFTFATTQLQFVSPNSGTIVNNSSSTQTFSGNVAVFFNGSKTFAANTGALNFTNVVFRGDAMAAGQTNTLVLSGASNGSISGSLSQTGTYTQTVAGLSNALTKTGTGTYTISGSTGGAGAFTGLITVNNGTLALNRATVSWTGANALTFTGTSRFNMNNTGATAAQALTLGALTFSGGDGTVQTTRTAAFDERITFASLSTRAVGATGNFVNTGTNGTTNGFVLTAAPTAGQIIDPGLFYNGSAYATYDSTGFVRGLIYGTDTNATTATGTQSSLTLGATTDAQYTGSAQATATSGVASGVGTPTLAVTDGTLFTVGQAITGTNIPNNTVVTAISGNTLTLSNNIGGTAVPAGTALTTYNFVSAQDGGTLSTLNLSGVGASMMLAPSQTLAVGAILRSGNTTAGAAITGGTAVTAATAGGELVVRADTANDSLVINTPVQNNSTASSFTKSGAGLVNLLNTGTNYTGATRINAGTLRFNKTTTTAGNITSTSSISVASGGTLQLFVSSNSTNTLAAPLTLSGNGVSTSYSLEFPSGNTQTNNITGGITLVGGAIIRGFGLGNNYNFNTTAITGNATGSGLTFQSEGGNQTAANQIHYFNINVAATYTGNTTLNALSQNGHLRLGVTNALPATTSLQLTGSTNVNTSATLNLAGRNQTLAGLTATPNSGGARVVNEQVTTSTLTINNPAAVTFSGVLGGTGTNHNNFGLTKSNAGIFTLTGVNTYTGATTVNGGILRINSASSLGSSIGATTVATGGTLDLNGAANLAESITLSGTGSNSVGALINNSVTSASIAAGGIVSISGVPVTGFGSGYSTPPAVAISGTGTGATAVASLGLTDASVTAITVGGTGYAIDDLVNITGGGGSGAIAKVTAVDGAGAITAISITNAGLGYTTAPTGMTKNTSVLGSTSPAMTLTGNATNFTVGSLPITATGTGYLGTPTLTIGGDPQPATLNITSVVLAGNGSIGGTGDITINPVVSGAFDLTKAGTNTVTLAATNTYSGATTVLEGTLSLSSPALSDSAALTIGAVASSPAVLNLPSAGTDTVGSLIIDGVTQPNGLYDSTNSGGAITGSGKIQVGTGGDAYSSWAGSFGLENPWLGVDPALNGDPTGDPDADGISNLLEFVLGGSPVASSAGILPTLTNDGSNSVLSYKRSDESEATSTQTGQWSTDLATWTDVTPVLVNENGALADDMTITVPNANAVAGKLFLRLNAVK